MKSWLLAGALLGGTPALAQTKAPAPADHRCRGEVCIDFVDLTPRFLAFEQAARAEADPEKRYAIWKDRYGFAAVPPGPRGDAMARSLLDQGWPHYARALPQIRAGGARMEDETLATLDEITKLLGRDGPLTVRVVAYVGSFEDNAFTYAMGPTTVVNFPVETAPEKLRLLETHELTHAVHLKTAGLSGDWERSIAQTLISEGLAMRMTQALRPGWPDRAYTSNKRDWLAQATARKSAILSDMLPVLDRKDSETVWRFTIGQGPAGLEREA